MYSEDDKNEDTKLTSNSFSGIECQHFIYKINGQRVNKWEKLS
jgi:hypothetical protein